MKNYYTNIILSATILFLCTTCKVQVKNENNSEKMKDFEETMLILRERGFIETDINPKKPESMPRYSDENPVGLSFLRYMLENEDFSFLDLERTFFNRSEVNTCSFESSKLKESNLCWNDFYHTDFSNADLSGADLRASIFEDIRFIGTNLSYADLRRSSFDDCDFTSAKMRRVKLTKEQGKGLKLSEKQINEIDWKDNEGKEPDGG